MLRTISIYGVIAGLIVAIPMCLMVVWNPFGHGAAGMIVGYALMLIALSFVFVGVKRYRDGVLGGVIKFLPALLVGLGISTVAGIFYCAGWEITLALTNYDFIESYPRSVIEQAQQSGMTAAELAELRAQMADFQANYPNPFYRIPMTFFVEIFPVGVLVSLITALILRNSRFFPARPAPAA